MTHSPCIPDIPGSSLFQVSFCPNVLAHFYPFRPQLLPQTPNQVSHNIHHPVKGEGEGQYEVLIHAMKVRRRVEA